VGVHLDALRFDSLKPARLARFWSGVLGWELAPDRLGGDALMPSDDTGFGIRFRTTAEPKVGLNQMHFDLTSTSPADQEQTVARSLRLGATHLDVGQVPEDGHVVLADPEGNEYCVIEPGNSFLADCGFFGALASDGSQAVGYFWRDALDWPLVWDQDEETAIRSPHGGPKVTWGGPPLNPRKGPTRLHFDLTPSPDSDRQAEVDRLIALGARGLDGRPAAGRADGWVLMVDPDGNEFRVLAGA